MCLRCESPIHLSLAAEEELSWARRGTLLKLSSHANERPAFPASNFQLGL